MLFVCLFVFLISELLIYKCRFRNQFCAIDYGKIVYSRYGSINGSINSSKVKSIEKN